MTGSQRPDVIVPVGFQLVERDWGWTIEADPKERLSSTISFRVTSAEYSAWRIFVETFPERTFAVAMRWLRAQPTVADLIRGRIETDSEGSS